MVRLAGLEPARVSPLPPQSSVSANSTISATSIHTLPDAARESKRGNYGFRRRDADGCERDSPQCGQLVYCAGCRAPRNANNRNALPGSVEEVAPYGGAAVSKPNHCVAHASAQGSGLQIPAPVSRRRNIASQCPAICRRASSHASRSAAVGFQRPDRDCRGFKRHRHTVTRERRDHRQGVANAAFGMIDRPFRLDHQAGNGAKRIAQEFGVPKTPTQSRAVRPKQPATPGPRQVRLRRARAEQARTRLPRRRLIGIVRRIRPPADAIPNRPSWRRGARELSSQASASPGQQVACGGPFRAQCPRQILPASAGAPAIRRRGGGSGWRATRRARNGRRTAQAGAMIAMFRPYSGRKTPRYALRARRL